MEENSGSFRREASRRLRRTTEPMKSQHKQSTSCISVPEDDLLRSLSGSRATRLPPFLPLLPLLPVVSWRPLGEKQEGEGAGGWRWPGTRDSVRRPLGGQKSAIHTRRAGDAV
ncbi:Hypothetical predicted protein [Xyrichtys novacula]|uniref:Uncharacterized protein n=1 Tax=Xyrichtys novacula TaxID=13765 RepID=A0AAV1GL22_XYRNO|nr:Hypothetical predicted protein [Xyrichtys novacula]